MKLLYYLIRKLIKPLVLFGDIMFTCALFCVYIFKDIYVGGAVVDYADRSSLSYKRNPAPDGHRCGVCPTYYQKICATNLDSNATYVFDNHCIMDLYNCIEGTEFVPIKYEHCIYFGNFAYVHGFKNIKYEDLDYGEDFIDIKT